MLQHRNNEKEQWERTSGSREKIIERERERERADPHSKVHIQEAWTVLQNTITKPWLLNPKLQKKSQLLNRKEAMLDSKISNKNQDGYYQTDITKGPKPQAPFSLGFKLYNTARARFASKRKPKTLQNIHYNCLTPQMSRREENPRRRRTQSEWRRHLPIRKPLQLPISETLSTVRPDTSMAYPWPKKRTIPHPPISTTTGNRNKGMCDCRNTASRRRRRRLAHFCRSRKSTDHSDHNLSPHNCSLLLLSPIQDH